MQSVTFTGQCVCFTGNGSAPRVVKRPAADPRKQRHALVLVRSGSDALAEFAAGLAERETKIIRSKIGKNQLTLAITSLPPR